MRSTLILSFLILSSLCFAQTNKTELKYGQFKLYQNDTIRARIREIVRTDSNNLETEDLIYKSFDKHGTLVEEIIKYHQWQNDSKNGYLTQNIYNNRGKIILYEHFDTEGHELERYKYDYNEKGLLISKEGFGSGEIGITIKYYYSDSGTLIDKKAFRFGKEQKDYFKTMK